MLPDHDQLACLLNKGKLNSDNTSQSEPSVDEINRFRSTHPEATYLSNPEIIRRYFK